ncbi:hypothetical protein E5163_10165 [Marinicauda algicola]|uniref:Teneurin-like YD-shell domain-containing protein n=1 Tax=Marinicauda algicola TaxID=2029849 RepID=A0A4V3RXX4_9PROT|nr:hypothetical protein [Marinicauda algicola]TGY88189.1 hypothetical protein E5163_10165 [Marinicauda algicola]
MRTDQTFHYGYDNLGRITSVSAPSGTPGTSYSYDLFNQVRTVSANGQTITNSHDSLGQLLSQAGPNGTVSYQYDTAGRGFHRDARPRPAAPVCGRRWPG